MLDQTSYKCDGLPAEFYRLHWTWFESGEPSDDFLKLMVERVRKLRRSEVRG